MTVSGLGITGLTSTSGMRPALRRAVLARDDGCTIDGCNSVYRFEVHRVVERSKGGLPRQPCHPLLVAPPHGRPPTRHAHRSPVIRPEGGA